ncbi:uncharacterized protein F4812DRAFT_459033 [Daldinia caldariorum]|uniref:uncharacterized protein n=1 Tax=Daldinia caldariorum TaxID=326644 RepID=UPI0020076038|nr:uncharacterized protein F4812DRAFT_459033 [Daldinia caldariorum]KAI1467744.1 hypothetical protein F4812DRAFT_459033 [Daldinia caldariorum]
MAGRARFSLVTGCGQGGMGEALVREFTKQNVRPIATLVPNEPTEHLDQGGLRDGLKKHVYAVTGGDLDILVNNA